MSERAFLEQIIKAARMGRSDMIERMAQQRVAQLAESKMVRGSGG